MRFDSCLYAFLGLANASALIPRSPQEFSLAVAGIDTTSSFKPKTHNPEFFSLKVDDKCQPGEDKSACPLAGFAIRLEGGNVIATPYNRWWDAKLPIFFVDDDTRCYTVSASPLKTLISQSSTRYETSVQHGI
jgi:hypothetical protein